MATKEKFEVECPSCHETITSLVEHRKACSCENTVIDPDGTVSTEAFKDNLGRPVYRVAPYVFPTPVESASSSKGGSSSSAPASGGTPPGGSAGGND